MYLDKILVSISMIHVMHLVPGIQQDDRRIPEIGCTDNRRRYFVCAELCVRYLAYQIILRLLPVNIYFIIHTNKVIYLVNTSLLFWFPLVSSFGECL